MSTDSAVTAVPDVILCTLRVPRCPPGELRTVVREADRLCPYSNALRGNVPVAIQVHGGA